MIRWFGWISLSHRVAAEFLFYLYPPQFERDGVLSLWYRELYSELELHPLRTKNAFDASVFFLGIDVSCAYLYPVYAAPAPGDLNYVQEGRFGPLGNAKLCRDTRKARLEAYVRNGWAPFWGIPGKQHIVFDQLCYHPLMELVHADPFVSLAGVGHLKGRAYGYRPGIDISWPEMPVTVDHVHNVDHEHGNGPCSCQVQRSRLVSFQGAGTRKVREQLQELHDGDQIVVDVVDVSRSSLNTTDARWNVSHPIKQPFATLMRESDFALAPAGHTQCSLRLYEILSFCTIPVILADEKLLPFNEILNWSEMAVMVSEKAALTVPERLRNISAAQRCSMRQKAHEAFHKYFANVSANVRGLMEVLEIYWRQGFGPTEESRRLQREFQQHSMSLSWSPLAKEDQNCQVSLDEVLTYASSTHQRSLRALACWAMCGCGRQSGDMCAVSWEEISKHFQAFHGPFNKNELREVFQKRDVDGNGELTLEEGGEWTEEALGLLELLVTSAFQRSDVNRDLALNQEEFGAQVCAEELVMKFSKLDFNNDGYIALRELLWQPLLSVSIRNIALEQGFLLADDDADGQLSGAEMERPPGQQLLTLLADFPMAIHTPRCHRVWHHNAPNVIDELKRCGFIHILPGLFPQDFVFETRTWAQKSKCNELPIRNHSEESHEPPEALVRLLQEVVGSGKCCSLASLQVMCLPTAFEDWRLNDAPVLDRIHYTVLLTLETVTVPVLGVLTSDGEEKDNQHCANVRALRSQDGYVARYLSAGSVLIFDATLATRHFAAEAPTRFLRYELVESHLHDQEGLPTTSPTLKSDGPEVPLQESGEL